MGFSVDVFFTDNTEEYFIAPQSRDNCRQVRAVQNWQSLLKIHKVITANLWCDFKCISLNELEIFLIFDVLYIVKFYA